MLSVKLKFIRRLRKFFSKNKVILRNIYIYLKSVSYFRVNIYDMIIFKIIDFLEKKYMFIKFMDIIK